MSILFGPVMPDTWDSVNNLFGSQDQAAMLPSGFFPAPQKLEPIRSEIAQPAVSLGVPRLTTTDAPSIAQSAAWAYQNWFGSPYEAELSIPARPAAPSRASTPSFLTEVSKPWETMAGSLWTGVEETFIEANKLLPGLMLEKLGLAPERQVVNTKGDIEYHVYGTPPMSLATIPGLKQEQPQSLFNIGFDPGIKTPVVPIAQPSTAAMSFTPILILLGLYLFTR